MTIHELHLLPEPEMQEALVAFERQFSYPLGPTQRFRIEHSRDYAAFCRAMGEGRCFVYEEQKAILGTLGVSLRSIKLPDGSHTEAAYIFDAKVADVEQRGYVLLKMAQAAIAWISRYVTQAFAVVMDGTTIQPTRYTGRLGIPAFKAIGKISILRIPTTGTLQEMNPCDIISNEESVRERLELLSNKAYLCPSGNPTIRSSIAPIWLADPSNTACGCLEDTRQAKRLFTLDGEEMKSAHWSSFGYTTPIHGARLMRSALALARERNYPAMFVSIPIDDSTAVTRELADLQMDVATATVFGYQLDESATWMINTSEI